MIVDINDFKSAIESANVSVDKLKEDFKHQLEFELNMYLHEIVNIVFDKFPLLNRFAIVGYTPNGTMVRS